MRRRPLARHGDRPVEDPHRPCRPAPAAGRRRRRSGGRPGRRRTAGSPGRPDARDGRPGPVTVEKVVALCTSRDPGIGEPGEAACDEIAARAGSTTFSARHELAWHHLWDRCDVKIEGPVRASLGPPPARLPPAADRVPAQHRPRRRHPGPRPARRGLPRPRLLGRAVRPALPEPAAAGGGPRDAAVPVAPAPQARAAARAAGHRGAMFPWQSGSTGREESPDPAPQPPVGPLAARQLPPAAAHRTRRRLQHLALLRGDRGRRLPDRVRRRTDAVSRRFWADLATLRPRRRPLRHLRRDGPRRVPRRATRGGTSRGWTTTPTRTSWRPGP